MSIDVDILLSELDLAVIRENLEGVVGSWEQANEAWENAMNTQIY